MTKSEAGASGRFAPWGPDEVDRRLPSDVATNCARINHSLGVHEDVAFPVLLPAVVLGFRELWDGGYPKSGGAEGLIARISGHTGAGRERGSTRAGGERERGDPRRRSSMRETFREVASPDGTTIAFDGLGDGPPVILVCGAMCDRALMRPTAEELAKHFTVFNY